MLKIYFGREDLNKDKFIFDNIKGRTILLVPDQFTLQAERNAFFYMGKKGFMDLEVLSISRLGARVLRQTGGAYLPMINKYGRHMLLTKILEKENDSMKLYRNQAGRNSFIEMVNNMIAELKQYGTGTEELAEIKDGIPEDSYLRLKLEDILHIYEEYEKEIEGKYTDTEDLNDLYAEKIGESELLRENAVWVYGFDSFTPKNMQIISRIAKVCKDVHVVLTCNDPDKRGRDRDSELFDLTRQVIRVFREEAEKNSIECTVQQVPEEYVIGAGEKAPALISLEKELYSYPSEKIEEAESIELVRAANIYAEAETAAAKVLELVRDNGARYRDIMLICNDLEKMGGAAERVFSQYGMDLFVDRKRSLVYSPAVTAILALVDILRMRYRTHDVFRFLKTGLSPLTREQVEKLEIYAIRFKIKGGMWKKPFRRGAAKYTEEEFAELENSRKIITDLTESFGRKYRAGKDAGTRIKALYGFLTDEAKMPERLEELVREQTEAGFIGLAGETAQAWNYIVDILDQMMQIMGEETVSDSAFVQILEAGFGAIEIGLLPPTADGLVMGSMQRTRAGRPRYTLVLGANDGILPAGGGNDSLLSGDEKKKLFEEGIEICRMDELRVQEEKLAIYRNLVRASEGLWISCSISDETGEEMRPSVIFERIRKMTGKEPEKDIVSREDSRALVQSSGSTLKHLANAIKHSGDASEEDRELWQGVFNWYRKNQNRRLTDVLAGLRYSNRVEALKSRTVKELFRRTGRDELVLSPSALEKYSKCPFSFFIQRGLKPEEPDTFEISYLDIGNVYHEVLMRFSQSMTEKGVDVTAEGSRWMTVTREDADRETDRIVDEIVKNDPEGVFSSGKEAEYRIARLRKNCRETVWTLIEDIRKHEINSIVYEAPFGKNMDMAPVRVSSEKGEILIEGRIDRADLLTGDRVKVIDYKTGEKSFEKDAAEAGWDLQLMLYLAAAENGGDGSAGGKDREPAGVYYFKIKEPYADMSGKEQEKIKETITEAIMKKFSFEGVTVTTDEKSKEPGKKMSPQEFDDFSAKVSDTVEKLCARLAEGDIGIKPKSKFKKYNACEYCEYHSICAFEPGVGGCGYEWI
ncbi:MAG: PD-(D/E)XK nuclease family protein [Firmicutes bacterium]|nr:PD-(D/E)XK nuclease family protein [Bacillota bacterium]